jgi:hypothetical protein
MPKIQISIVNEMLPEYFRQRTGLCDGGELEFRPPITDADKNYLVEVKN